MYLVLNAGGEVEREFASDNLTKVEKEIARDYPRHSSFYTVADPQIRELESDVSTVARAENPPDQMPGAAMRGSGLPWDEARGVGITMADVEKHFPLTDAGLRKAYDALLPYLSVSPTDYGAKEWKTPASMASNLLKTNTKTKKAVLGVGVTIPPSFGVGINVMPYALGALMSGMPAAEQERAYYADPKNRARPFTFRSLPLVAPALGKNGEPTDKTREMRWSVSDMRGLCVGSSKDCRATCLVFTGQNGAVAANDIAKMKTERALFFQPLAFARMLIAAVEFHYRACRKKKLAPFVRLNVYSDIPWELFFPDLFRHFEKKYGHDIEKGGLWFYDYTKLEGRGPRPMPNYDLTFSYSGGNLAATKRALEGTPKHGPMRVAVVFARKVHTGAKLPLFEVVPSKKGLPRMNVGAETEAEARSVYQTKLERMGKKLSGALSITKRRGATFEPDEPVTDILFAPWGKDGGVYPVIDGDPYDMRPLDPTGVVVGLRFKVPKKLVETNAPKTKSHLEHAAERAGKFVVVPPRHNDRFLVKAERLDGNWYFSPVVPEQTNVDVAAQLDEANRRRPTAAE